MKDVKVLFVEDEAALGMVVSESLQMRGFEIYHCEDGDAGWQSYLKNKPDICVLDVMLPKKDGFSLGKEIRNHNSSVPIIFLTARSKVEDVVKGFEMGGNDYLKKPFSMEELIVRIKALLKRSTVTSLKNEELEKLEIGSFHFFPQQQLLERNGKDKKLTHRESELLKLLCLNRNHVIDRKIILDNLWGDDSFYNARSMDVFITKLRKYLKEDPNLEIINVRGVGYKLVG